MSNSEADRRQQALRALAIIRQFNESDLESLHIRQDDFEIALSRTGDVSLSRSAQQDAAVPAVAPASAAGAAAPVPAALPVPQAAASAVPLPAAPAPASSANGATAGQVVVRAPMVGTIYLAPDPGSPPFVTPGSRVEPSDTVMLIEAMKLFTAVTAGRAGIVRSVLTENASFVEYGQELLTIDADPE